MFGEVSLFGTHAQSISPPGNRRRPPADAYVDTLIWIAHGRRSWNRKAPKRRTVDALGLKDATGKPALDYLTPARDASEPNEKPGRKHFLGLESVPNPVLRNVRRGYNALL